MSSGIIQLFPVLRFLRVSWKIITAGAVLGLFAGSTYLALQPPIFQARLMISMAQVPTPGDFSAFANIEEPVFLIERLKIPSVYTTQVIDACKNGNEQLRPESIEQLINAGIPRVVKNVVSIRINRESPELAEQCASALFEMIRKQQEILVRPIQEELTRTLKSLQMRHDELTNILRAIEKQQRFEVFYFAKSDQLIQLNQKILDVDRVIQSITPTKLAVPTYVSPKPINMQSPLILMAAALAGLLFGLILAGFRELTRWQTELTETQT